VVRKAKEAMSETSGATSGSNVAAYLRGDAEAAPAGDKLLERLTVAAPPKTVEPAAVAAPEQKIDQTKLASLARPTEKPDTTPTPAPAPAPADLSQANEKLSSLLGKPDGK
jgi:hypothetical protein